MTVSDRRLTAGMAGDGRLTADATLSCIRLTVGPTATAGGSLFRVYRQWRAVDTGNG